MERLRRLQMLERRERETLRRLGAANRRQQEADLTAKGGLQKRLSGKREAKQASEELKQVRSALGALPRETALRRRVGEAIRNELGPDQREALGRRLTPEQQELARSAFEDVVRKQSPTLARRDDDLESSPGLGL